MFLMKMQWMTLSRVFLVLGLCSPTMAQRAASEDSLMKTPGTLGGIYDRPYIYRESQLAIGGYFEMNSNFVREEGISEGWSFEARRFNLFAYSSIANAITLTSELEFEHGTEEIKIETALVDLLLSNAINVRAGILLAPLGRFNITHDSPRYDIIDRPLVSTEIIPATLSEVGAGFFGAFYFSAADRLTYELYAVNGLQDGVVGGSGDGTRIPAGKAGGAFEEDNNGRPSLTARLAYNPGFGGEFGISAYTGAYNTFKIEGEPIDEKRRLSIYAIDAEVRLRRLYLRGEAALANIDIQPSLAETFGDRQAGFYLDLGYELMKKPVWNFPDASLTLVTRFDYVDLNDGTFASTGQNIGDSTFRVTGGLSFRPSRETSIRLSLWRNWHWDVFDNKRNSMNFQLGLATYF